MNEEVWESLDSLSRTVSRLSRRVSELEAQLADIKSSAMTGEDENRTEIRHRADQREAPRQIA